jgi:AcrR family transcriptional regulator
VSRGMARTLPAEIRKEQILKAARAVLAEKGFSQMRVSEVVEKAGLSQGSFYLHFPSKEAVVAELVHSMILDATALVEEATSPDQDMEASLRATLTSYYKVCFRYRDVLESTAGGAASGMDRAEWNELYRPLNEFMLDLVRRWQAKGEIREDVDPNIVSWLVIDTVNGAMERLFGHSGNRVSDDYETFIIGWLLSALRNLQIPAGKRGA